MDDNTGKRGTDKWRPPYFDALVAYYADPSDQRTLEAWCEENGVTPNTIHAYKRNHPVELWTAVDNTRSVYIPKMRREAFNAVFANIKKSHLDRKLALQLTNDLIERSSTNEKALTPQEKRELAADLLAKLSAKLDKGA